MELFVIVFILAVIIITAKLVSMKKKAQAEMKQALTHTGKPQRMDHSVPCQASAKAVAQHYAPGFCGSIKAVHIGVTLLALILFPILISEVDAEAGLYALLGGVVLNILVYISFQVACLFFRVAVDKGYRQEEYIITAFWLGIVGYVLIAALPNLHANVPPASRSQ